jgi:predicted Ser/Thr protein kinase
MGVVYKARQKSLNRLVALKLLAPERADDPQFAVRFEKEAQALAALNHTNIVAIHDFGQAGGYYFLLMEFVDGVNLRQLLQTKRLTPKEALSIVPPVCDALQCAHDHGIVHRDIKPENLLMDKAGRVKIADFGIAKIVGDSEQAEGTPRTDGTMAQGTPDYAAPEQQNGTADHRADIYSLGVVLYEMLTGERPNENFTPPSKRVQVDIRIDEIVLRALEKTPELRFQTAAAFRTQVEAIEEAPDAVPSEYISSWGFRLTTGPAIKTGTVRFWEKLFGSVESPGAIHSINLSRLGNIGFLALLAILPGMRWCWLAFCFLWMFGLVGVAYLSETAARRGVDLSKTGGLPDAVSQRAVWRNRIFQLIIGGSLVPMVFFVVALTGLLMLGGDKVIEAATTEQMLIVFAKVLGFGTGLALLIWAVMRAFRKKDNPWPRHLEALIAMELLWPLLLIAAPIFLWEFVSATRPLSARMNTEDWILFGVVAAFFLHGAVLVTRNVQRTVREANDPTARREPEPPTHSRWQGWDVWVTGLCLVIFGALWLLQLSEGPLLNRSLFAGAGVGSNVVLPVALATTILLAGAAFLYMLARNIKTASPTRSESWKRRIGRAIVPTIAVALLVRTFVIHPFVVPNNSMSPEITKGSRILVWKLSSTYAPGDIVAYRHEDKVWVARVTQAGQTTLTLQKNSKLDSVVQREAVVGKVISVFWRPSPGAAAPEVPSLSIKGSADDADRLTGLSWHQFDQTQGKYWRELADRKRFAEAAKLIEHYLSLHPELEEGLQRINGSNLHFHAAQCWAFANDNERAHKHLSESKHVASDGDFLWNDYVAGTAAFLRGDRDALLASRNALHAKGAAINQTNLAVLERLLAHFGQPYFDAYYSNRTAPQPIPVIEEGAKLPPQPTTKRLASFSPTENPSPGEYVLGSFLAEPRHVALAEFAFVDERYSTAYTISRLGFYLASPDGAANVGAVVTWTVENVTEGEGAWLFRIKGGAGVPKFEASARLGGKGKSFSDIPRVKGRPDNPERGGDTTLDPATTKWVHVRPERSYFVSPSDWSAEEWHSLKLFEAKDDTGKVLGHIRLRLLVRAMLPDAKYPWKETPYFRNGDWTKDKELMSVIGEPL